MGFVLPSIKRLRNFVIDVGGKWVDDIESEGRKEDLLAVLRDATVEYGVLVGASDRTSAHGDDGLGSDGGYRSPICSHGGG